MKKILISDLDGTLLKRDGKINTQVVEDLKSIKKEGYTRVIATGRSIYSFYKAIEEDFPIDYLVFSSGSGVLNWKTKEIIYNKNLTEDQTIKISDKLINNKVDFMILEPAPNSHYFKYHKANDHNPDFQSRFKIYNKYNTEIRSLEDCYTRACQILAILPNKIELFNNISSLFNNTKVIRSTSPIDDTSIWLEIFPKEVSKGLTCKWLMDHLEINIENSIGIGNDYNDIDFLDICKNSYIVNNANNELKEKYKTIPSLFDNSLFCIKELQNGHK